jgi:hypothetical protein
VVSPERLRELDALVARFIKARLERVEEDAWTAADPFLSGDAILGFSGHECSLSPLSNPHYLRHQILNHRPLGESAWSITVRIFDEYTGFGEIGYHEETMLVRAEGTSFRIHEVAFGKYVDLGKSEEFK